MIKDERQRRVEEVNSEVQELQESIKQLREEIQQSKVYKDLYYLKDEAYYRQQSLILMDRIAEALEKLQTLSSDEESENN